MSSTWTGPLPSRRRLWRSKRWAMAGASVNTRDDSGWTPLIWAARWGDDALLTHILAHGGGADAVAEGGATPLMWAAPWGTTEGVRLLRHGALPN